MNNRPFLAYLLAAIGGATGPIVVGPALAANSATPSAAGPWWGPYVIGLVGTVGGPILLWLVKTVAGATIKAIVASLRAWAQAIRAKAKQTPDVRDDVGAEVQAKGIEAAADAIEKAEGKIPIGKPDSE